MFAVQFTKRFNHDTDVHVVSARVVRKPRLYLTSTKPWMFQNRQLFLQWFPRTIVGAVIDLLTVFAVIKTFDGCSHKEATATVYNGQLNLPDSPQEVKSLHWIFLLFRLCLLWLQQRSRCSDRVTVTRMILFLWRTINRQRKWMWRMIRQISHLLVSLLVTSISMTSCVWWCIY